jgi:hypothetical protein
MSIDITAQFIKSAGNLARGDLFVCDACRIDREKCAALIAHDPALPAPKTDDIYAFVRDTFGGAVVPQIATATVHPYEHAVSITLTANMMQRPAQDADGMRQVTANLYAEDDKRTRTASLWSLVTGSNGQRYLVRNVDEDVFDIVTRVSRRNHHHPGITLASLRTAAPIVDVGDSIKFFGSKNQVLYGVISAVNGDSVTVETKNDGQTHTVSRYSIVEVTAKGPDAQARDKAKLEDFFSVAFGSREFAQQLTQRDVNDEGIRNSVPSFGNK